MESVEDIFQSLASEPNKFQRKKKLESLKSSLNSPNDLDLKKLWVDHHKILYQSLQDESERCREISAEVIKIFMDSNVEIYLHYLIPILDKRLGNRREAEFEPSEEVRLALTKLLLSVMKEEVKLDKYMDEVLAVVKSGLEDKFAELKAVACEVVMALAVVAPRGFKMGAMGLAAPVVKNFSHQHKKIRLASIQAMVPILSNSDTKTFTDSSSHLAQRLFDSNHEVRLAVAQLAGQLLLHWDGRHASMPLLVPLILTGLEDEMESNRTKVRDLWEEGAQKWIEEEAKRDKRVKDMIDFPFKAPKHYPENVIRPTDACRFLASKQFYKLKEALERDLKDWLPETRIKSSQLLFQLILHLENDLNGHADPVLKILNVGVLDTEKEVVRNVLRSAELFGYFVPPKYWLILEHSRLQEINIGSPNYRELRVLSKIISGSDPDVLSLHLEDFTLILQEERLCYIMEDDFQGALLSCADSILRVCGASCLGVQPQLFKIGISTLSLAQSPTIKQKAEGFLNSLSEVLGHPTLSDLFKHEMGPLIKKFRQSCTDWTPVSPEARVFSTLVSKAGKAVAFFADGIMTIFKAVLDKDCAELKMEMLLIIAEQLYNVKDTIGSNGNFDAYSQKVILDLILPHFPWHAGKKCAAVRIAAITCIYSGLYSGAFTASCLDKDLLDKLVPAMCKLLDDGTEKVRIFTCKSFKLLLATCKNEIPRDLLLLLSKVLVQRLEDVSDEIRILAMEALGELEACISKDDVKEDEELGKMVEKVIGTLFIHMDDRNVAIRAKSLDTLQRLGRLNSGLLKEKMSKATEKHKHKEELEKLNQYLAGLTINNV